MRLKLFNKTPAFGWMIFIDLLPIPLAFLLFPAGGYAMLAAPVLFLFIINENYASAENAGRLTVLSVCTFLTSLLFGTIIMQMYYKVFSSDPMTLMVGRYLIAFTAAAVLIVCVIAVIKKARIAKQR